MPDAPHYNFAALALPIFAAAIAAEIWLARRRGRLRDLYATGTAISDVGCGAAFQAMEVLLTLATFAAYSWVYEHARIVDWPAHSPWPWVLGLLGVDLLYYWWHRLSHVCNVMWAVHGVHHQSEDYNLAVALRQPLLEPVTWFALAWLLALVGVPTEVMVLSFGINLFYQFWIHTELVDRLPRPLEWVLNTPSHHRVHHGIEAQYLDRNYGGVLIVWDRLLGTFQAEQARPTYGTTIPLRSYNPLWGNVQHLARTWTLCRAAPRWVDKLWVWLAHPAWLPRGVDDPQPKVDRRHYAKYRPRLSRSTGWYLALSLALVASVAAPFVMFGHALPLPQIVAAVIVLVLTYVALGGMAEGRSWADPLDWARMLAMAGVGAWLCGAAWGLPIGLAVGAALALGSVGLRAMVRPGRRPDAAEGDRETRSVGDEAGTVTPP